MMSFNNIIHSPSITGIEIVSEQNGMLSFNVLTLEKKKAGISAIATAERIKAEELPAHIKNKTPVMVTISGKGIIHKKISTKNGTDEAALIDKVLPGATSDSFCVQLTALNSHEAFVSLIRRELLHQVLEILLQNNIRQIAGCFLGPFALNALEPQVQCVTQAGYNTNAEHIICDLPETDNGVTEIIINNERIPAPLFIAFGCAFAYFTGYNEGIINSEQILELTAEQKAYELFNKRMIRSLAAVFIILTANFFIFSNYWKKNTEMQAEYMLNAAAYQHYDVLTKELLSKKKILEENGLLENSRTSFYADRLAATLPASISWTSFKVNPRKLKSNNDADIYLFDNKIIDIAGTCLQSQDLNQWMKLLKKNEWVQHVDLLSYTQSKKNEPGEFFLQLSIW